MAEPEPKETTELKGRPAASDAKSWLDYLGRLHQEAPARYEDAAKFLVTIISLTISILLTAYEKLALLAPKPVYIMVILLLWLVALLLAFLVLSPHKYPVAEKEIASIKALQARIIKRKRRYFTGSVWLYFGALAAMVVLYVIYLLHFSPVTGVLL